MKISFNFTFPDFDAEDLKTYERYATKVSASMVSRIILGVLVVSVPFWPTDHLIFADRPDILHALFIWRVAIVSISVVMLLLLKYVKFFTQHPILSFNLSGALLMLITGYALGRTGGIENPTFYGVFAVPFITIVLIMSLPQRIFSTYLLPASYFIGFFAPFPEHLDHPLIGNPLLFTFGVCITVVLSGHVINRLFAVNYLRHLALKKKTTELIKYRRQLEQEVEERKAAEHELSLAKDGLEIRVKERTAELEDANEKLTQLAANLVTIQEEERNRISSELHDELGQLLTRLRMENYFLQNLMTADHPKFEEFKLASARSEEIIGKLQKSTRQLIMSLRSKVLDEEGLEVAIKVLIEDFTASSNRELSWAWSINDSELPPSSTKAVYRIVQESLTNISRHAGADHVTLDGRETEGKIIIRVVDNGKGFDRQAKGHKEGLGLKGMRDRARSLGGELKVDSQLGKGTAVILEIPLTRSSTET